MLLAEVATVEDRLGTTFVGLNAGWNTVPLRFVWGEWVELVPAPTHSPRARSASPSPVTSTRRPTCSPRTTRSRPSAEGDVVALLNVGGYCQAAGGRHCLRPVAPGLYLAERL